MRKSDCFVLFIVLYVLSFHFRSLPSAQSWRDSLLGVTFRQILLSLALSPNFLKKLLNCKICGKLKPSLQLPLTILLKIFNFIDCNWTLVRILRMSFAFSSRSRPLLLIWKELPWHLNANPFLLIWMKHYQLFWSSFFSK